MSTKKTVTVHKKVYLAFLDVLGFQELVKNSTTENLIRTFEQLTDIVASQLTYMAVHKENSISFELRKEQDLNYVIISDSIILWTNDIVHGSFYTIVAAVQNIIYHAFKHYVPLRGAIVCNSLAIFDNRFDTSQKNIEASLIGQAIVEGYELSNSQDWCGCFIDKECLKTHSEEFANFKKHDRDYKISPEMYDGLERDYMMNSIVKTKVPFKSGYEDGSVIQWAKVGSNLPVYDYQVQETFEKDKGYKGQSTVKIKIQNTIEFVSAYSKKV